MNDQDFLQLCTHSLLEVLAETRWNAGLVACNASTFAAYYLSRPSKAGLQSLSIRYRFRNTKPLNNKLWSCN